MYVGIDVHKKQNVATVVNEKGVVVQHTTMLNTDKALDKFLEWFPANTKFALEACSVWEPVYDFIESKGFDVSLIHPKRTRLIAESRVKTDKIDATIIAQLLRVDMIHKSYVPDKGVRKLRFLVRHRRALVSTRIQIKNRIHAILAREGITHELTDLFGKQGMLVLNNIPLRNENRFAINHNLELLEEINQKIKETNEYIETRSKDIKEIETLKTIPGISTYSAMVIYAEIADIKRFSNWKKLCGYSGLTSSVHQSGDTERYGNITKEGSKMLRWILIQCVKKTSRKPNGIQRFYLKILQKKGPKKATVAAARKLLVYIYIMLTQNKTFQELRVNSA
jgi:transposase